MSAKSMRFGGDWTEEKLERIRKYLCAYTTALKKQPFSTIYIDAFAGTGYREKEKGDPGDINEMLFPELAQSDTQRLLDGSARISLNVKPAFNRYIFIEKDRSRCIELEKLREEFPEKASYIRIINDEAKTSLTYLCSSIDWKSNRAVLFLDPFGMQVSWQTVEMIADTKAIDLWYLFPVNALTRLMTKDGAIKEGWKNKINDVLDSEEWQKMFYSRDETLDLFNTDGGLQKNVNIKALGTYFNTQLKTIFPGVANNPLPLSNSKNVLFLLCFACGNVRGCKVALKIAQDILGK